MVVQTVTEITAANTVQTYCALFEMPRVSIDTRIIIEMKVFTSTISGKTQELL